MNLIIEAKIRKKTVISKRVKAEISQIVSVLLRFFKFFFQNRSFQWTGQFYRNLFKEFHDLLLAGYEQ